MIATVTNLTPPDDVTKPTQLRLDPVATVTGNIDAAQLGEINADFYCDAFSLVTKAPPIGARVLVLLKKRPAPDARAEPRFFVEPGKCRFMPGSLSLVEIADLENPRIDDVVHAIRKLRAEANAQAPRKEARRP
jgi:hypothetical protein